MERNGERNGKAAILAMLGLAIGLVLSVPVVGVAGDDPELWLFGAGTDTDGRLVVHWSSSWFEPGDWSFTLLGASKQPVCEGVAVDTDCDCHALFIRPDAVFVECWFDRVADFVGTDGSTCVATVALVDLGGEPEDTAHIEWRCLWHGYLPLVAVGGG